MPSQSESQTDLIAAYNSQHAHITSLVRPLDPEQLARRPSATAWSVAEVLEHLTLSDALALTAVDSVLRGAPFDATAADRVWRPTVIGKFITSSLSRPKPLKSPAVARPITVRAGGVEAFLACDLRFAELLKGSTARDWNAIRLRVPVAPWIPLKINLGDVFAVHQVHVARHVKQIERVIAAVC